MSHDLSRSVQLILPLALSFMLSAVAPSAANDTLLVFISAFVSGDDAAINAYHLSVSTGELKLLHRTTGLQQPFFLALSPNRKFLYATHAPTEFGGPDQERVVAFELVGRTGQLKRLNEQSALGSAACYLTVDASGKTVLVANYNTGNVASFPVQADGSLGEAATMFQHQEVRVNDDQPVVPHAHCIVVSSNNQFAFAADLGLDQIIAYRLDAAAAQLSPHRRPFVRTQPGAGPRHLTFHPHTQRAYAINELRNSITVFDHDVDSGQLIERQTLSTLPADFKGTSFCADVKITPDGRYLYGTNRGHDSIAAYRIQDDGTLSLGAIEPSGGAGPQNLAITPGGELLLCANMPGNNVAVFRIDSATGKLSRLGTPTSMPGPSCIMLP